MQPRYQRIDDLENVSKLERLQIRRRCAYLAGRISGLYQFKKKNWFFIRHWKLHTASSPFSWNDMNLHGKMFIKAVITLNESRNNYKKNHQREKKCPNPIYPSIFSMEILCFGSTIPTLHPYPRKCLAKFGTDECSTFWSNHPPSLGPKTEESAAVGMGWGNRIRWKQRNTSLCYCQAIVAKKNGWKGWFFVR